MIAKEIEVAVVEENSLMKFIGLIVLAILLGAPLLGFLASMAFAGACVFFALTRTDSWTNVLHVAAGFAGYVLVMVLVLKTQSGWNYFLACGLYSFFWIIWMQKKARLVPVSSK